MLTVYVAVALFLLQDIPYNLDVGIDVIYTPGHTGRDVSVCVGNTTLGTIVVSGLFLSFG